MLITLYGPDSYRRLKKLEEVLQNYREKHSNLSLERFDMAVDDSFLRLRNFVSTKSMFDSAQLAVLDNILESPPQKELKTLLKKLKDEKDITLVINMDKKPPAPYKFLLEKPAQSQEFAVLKGEQISIFIQAVAEEHGASVDSKTIRSLAVNYGGDTWGIAKEIEQLSFAAGKETQNTRAPDYFPLTNALKYGRTLKERLSALEMLLGEHGDDSARVFNTIAYRLRDAKEAERFANYDVAVKSGKLEYEEILLTLALGD